MLKLWSMSGRLVFLSVTLTVHHSFDVLDGFRWFSTISYGCTDILEFCFVFHMN